VPSSRTQAAIGDRAAEHTAESRARPRVDMRRLDHRCGSYRYVALRRRDIQPLRRFRNEQIAVLRQRHPLSEEDQERWFDEVVAPTHVDPEPSCLLVSILDREENFIGYGGLTNIDWHHRRAEVSFLVSPERAADVETYRGDACAFLEWIQRWAFDELRLHRLLNETYEFRTEHIRILEEAGFVQEGRLRHNIVDPFDPSRFTDSLIHGRCADQRAAT
jgi:RimJ/RimL family protein N-acetyltransferase